MNIIFILIPVFLLTMFSWLLNHFSKLNPIGEQGKINKVLSHQLDCDIVFFGSSVAEIQFNPKIIDSITGFNSYNMGLSGCSYDQADVLINEFSSYTTKCKWLAICLTYNDFAPKTKITNGGYYYPYLDNESVYTSLYNINPELIRKIRYIPFYKFSTYNKDIYNGVFNGFKSWICQPLTDTEYKGYHGEYSRIWPKDLVYNNTNREKAIIDNRVFEKFNKRIKELLEKDYKLLLIIPPFYREGYMTIDRFEEVKMLIKNTTSQNPAKVFYLDFTNNIICSNKNLFFNASHLTGQGTDTFSVLFSKKLMELSKQN